MAEFLLLSPLPHFANEEVDTSCYFSQGQLGFKPRLVWLAHCWHSLLLSWLFKAMLKTKDVAERQSVYLSWILSTEKAGQKAYLFSKPVATT